VSEKKLYPKITRPDYGGTSYIAPDLDAAKDEMEFSEPGDVFHIEMVEMTDEEYDALPEFDGW
jgi:hypothetical protein